MLAVIAFLGVKTQFSNSMLKENVFAFTNNGGDNNESFRNTDHRDKKTNFEKNVESKSLKKQMSKTKQLAKGIYRKKE